MLKQGVRFERMFKKSMSVVAQLQTHLKSKQSHQLKSQGYK